MASARQLPSEELRMDLALRWPKELDFQVGLRTDA